MLHSFSCFACSVSSLTCGDDCNIYMFMLIISICCFCNNQTCSERERKKESIAVTQLGLHDWGLVLIMFNSSGKKMFCFSSRPCCLCVGCPGSAVAFKVLFSTLSGLFSLQFFAGINSEGLHCVSNTFFLHLDLNSLGL